MKKEYSKPQIECIDIDVTELICSSPGHEPNPQVEFGEDLDNEHEYVGD